MKQHKHRCLIDEKEIKKSQFLLNTLLIWSYGKVGSLTAPDTYFHNRIIQQIRPWIYKTFHAQLNWARNFNCSYWNTDK